MALTTQKQMLLAQWSPKIPEEKVFFIQEALEKVPEDKVTNLGFTQLKDPIIGLVLGVCFWYFAVDRFYKGDIGLGIAKLLLGWVTLFIWNLIDIYFVWKGIKEDNFHNIMQAITFTK